MSDAPQFDWDQANSAHIARHGVIPAEVEEVFSNSPLVVLAEQKRKGESRILCAGLTKAGRSIQFVYTMRGSKIRVITAHNASRKLRKVL